MKFIIGGAHQGKTAYIREQYGIADSKIWKLCEIQDMEQVLAILCDATSDIACVTGFHLLVKYGVEHNLPMEDVVEQMLLAHPDLIIAMNEVGCGIIPLEREDRLYREQVGRVGCMLAERADQVVRVVCGIGIELTKRKVL